MNNENTSFTVNNNNFYEYKIVNNYFVVTIPEYGKFILDTGSLVSYSFKSELTSIKINQIMYPLSFNNKVNISKLNEFVKDNIDGTIGLDILAKTGLTLKRIKLYTGKVFFSVNKVKGLEIPFELNPYIVIKAKVGSSICRYCIDTGSETGYAKSMLIKNKLCMGEIEYYDFHYGEFTDLLHVVPLSIGKMGAEVSFCENEFVSHNFLDKYDIDAVGNITEHFYLAISFDFVNKRIIASQFSN